MNRTLAFALMTLQFFCLLNEGQGCTVHLAFRKRRKRTTMDEVSSTDEIRQYFSACLADKAVFIDGWDSIVDFSILLTNWYRVTEDITCLGDSTASCWNNELDVYVQSESFSDDVLQAGKDCIDQFEIDVSLDIYTYTPSRKKRDILSSSSLNELHTTQRRVFKRNLPTNEPDVRPAYLQCLNASMEVNSLVSLDYDPLTTFIDEHLQYSCDSRETSSSTEQLSRVGPYRFVALTRLDAPIRNIWLECAIEFYPPEPFWANIGSWSECSAPCDGGIQTRSRTCRDVTNLSVESDGCVGSNNATRPCNEQPCFAWSCWSTWSRCQCPDGLRTRSRTCIAGYEQVDDRYCDGLAEQSTSCSRYCPLP
ncbi:unnamed protein product [Clavelina lepadiformis]|uniref:Uncharacterized protein n=1 Tax=Clavelina lepadiformis TaxID=159417 RepID=A0ABP0FGW2_CLALP